MKTVCNLLVLFKNMQGTGKYLQNSAWVYKSTMQCDQKKPESREKYEAGTNREQALIGLMQVGKQRRH
jgi:hypothetical protein